MGLKKKIIKKTCKYLLSQGTFTSKRTELSEIRSFLKTVIPRKLKVDNIRIGGNEDGGYVVPDDFEGIKYCFSPGVGNLTNFEDDLIKKKINCYLADFSVNTTFSDELINFEKKFVGPISNENYINLKDWISSKIDYEKNNDLILQLDVEGDEYDIINSLDIGTLKKFRIILIEFHQLHYIFDSFTFKKIKKVFDILNKFFYCTHIHPNNNPEFIIKEKDIMIPPVMEFSYLRKDRSETLHNDLKFPSVLDRPNNPSRSDINLPKCWYKS
jgi:hypothetical protein|tara:strand:+ start:4449 stop:5258 length:810 start_codon:yes stop_codon:yes gene_type:complete